MTGAGLERQRLGDGSRAQEAHRLHGEVGSAIASSLPDPTQEVPTGAAHLDLALFCRLCVPGNLDSDVMVKQRIRTNAADPLLRARPPHLAQ